MEPLGTAVGIVSLGVQVCQGILDYYDGWQDYHRDITHVREMIEDLSHTFIILKSCLAGSDGERERDVVARVRSCLDSCVEGLNRLEKRASKLRSYKQPSDLRSKTWTQIQRACYPFRASTLAKLKEEAGELRENLSLALQVSQQSALADVREGVEKISCNQEVIERTAAIGWLACPDHYIDHGAARRKHEPNTGNWLLKSDEYDAWCKSTDGILWLTGKAGCGKTILFSTIVEDLRRQCRREPDTQFAFFYFSFSESRKQTLTGLISSLVAQLAQLPEVVQRLRSAHREYHTNAPPRDVLEMLFAACLKQQPQTVLAIDALDELPESGDDTRQAVLDWLEQTAQSGYRVRFFLASRHSVDLNESLAALGARCLSIDTRSTDIDIQKHISTALEKHPRLRPFSVSLKQDIRAFFSQKADGSFRWASCQLDTLKELKSTRQTHVRSAIHNLPSTLDTTYERMLLQIGDAYHDDALSALRWLAFQPQQITLGELWEAHLIDPETSHVESEDRGRPEDILEILAGLVVIEEKDDGGVVAANSGATGEGRSRISLNSRVRLAHFSVKEYLVSDRIMNGRAARYALNPDRDQHLLFRGCLTYLLHYSDSPSKTLTEQDLNEFLFLKSAAETWPALLSESIRSQSSSEAKSLLSERHISTWLKVHRPDTPWRGPFSKTFSITDMELPGKGIYYASYLGLTQVCRELLAEGADPNDGYQYHGRALQAASLQGHDDVVALLLRAGAADPNYSVGASGPALSAALKEGHNDIVARLLASGASLNLESDDDDDDDEDDDRFPHGSLYSLGVLIAANAWVRNFFLNMLRLGEEHDVRDRSYADALGSLPSYQDLSRWMTDDTVALETPIFGWAHDAMRDVVLRGGQREAREMLRLVDAEAEAREKGDERIGLVNGTLWAATVGGNTEMVRRVLEVYEADDSDSAAAAKSEEGRYGGALLAAAQHGRGEVLRLLLDAGADTKGFYFDRAVEAARNRGYDEILKMLEEAGKLGGEGASEPRAFATC